MKTVRIWWVSVNRADARSKSNQRQAVFFWRMCLVLSHGLVNTLHFDHKLDKLLGAGTPRARRSIVYLLVISKICTNQKRYILQINRDLLNLFRILITWKAQIKGISPSGQTQKMNWSIGSRSRCRVVVRVQVWVFWVRILRLVRISGRPWLRTYEAKPDFAASA